MSKKRFYDVVSAAVADLVQHGFDSQERVERWLRELRRAAEAAVVPEFELVAALSKALRGRFHAATADVVLQAKHKGIQEFTLERIKPKLRAELDRRLWSSVNLIKLNREKSIHAALQRFSGWASSLPIGGSEVVSRRKSAEQVRRSIAGLPFDERRVIIDQGHKLVAAVNDIVATEGGAIAMRWHHIHPGPHYHSRPEHLARNGKIFLIRDAWAHRDGLVKPAPCGYLDEIDKPGEAIFCSCSGVYLYSPGELPPAMWTEKGRRMVLRARTMNPLLGNPHAA